MSPMEVINRFEVHRGRSSYLILLEGVPFHEVLSGDIDAYDKTVGALLRYATGVYLAILAAEGRAASRMLVEALRQPRRRNLSQRSAALHLQQP